MIGGVASLRNLLRAGWSQDQVAAAVDSGVLSRVARGWYASLTADAGVVTAVRAGGRLGCLSGCRLHGLWVPHHGEPHVIVHRGDRTRENWHRHMGPLPSEAVFPLAECLAQVVRHHSPVDALVVLESAANQGKIQRGHAELLIAEASARKQRTLKFFNPAAESGSETKVRLWLQQNRIPVRAQVRVHGVGRVDHLVGRSCILECDSSQFHQYREEDYGRDIAAQALGFTVIRLSYRQVHYEWENTAEMLLRYLRTRRHLNKPRPL